MDKHRQEKLQFDLAEQVERLKTRQESGEVVIDRWIRAGVPPSIAVSIVHQSINSEGLIDAELFANSIEERLSAADTVQLFLNQMKKNESV